MNLPGYRILLIEDNREYAWMLELTLSQSRSAHYELVHVEQLQQALAYLGAETFDLVLLDLTLPDSQGYASFAQLLACSPRIPVIVMTALDDHRLALRAVRNGAQDYLVKGDLENGKLERSILFALERHQMVEKLMRQTMIDELTGLLNRRGFLSLAQQQLKIARRARRQLVLFFADLDGLKGINDQHGHATGDQALQAAAKILQSSFRSSDLIARLGGDEFTVLAIDAPEHKAGLMRARLDEKIVQFNLRTSAFQLSMSIGSARYDPQGEETELEQLLARADEALYQAKHARGKKMRI